MSSPWDLMRSAYAEGVTCEELSQRFGLPVESIKKKAKQSKWGIDRKAAVTLENIPAIREAGERVAKTADKAAIEVIRKAVEDMDIFRDKWRSIIANLDSADDLDSAASAMSRMTQEITAMLGIGRKGEDNGRGIVHIQLATPSATANNSPVIELPAN